MAICNPALQNCEANVSNPTAYFNNIIQGVFSIFFIVGILYFIWHFVMAGYHFISSNGDEKKIVTAKNEILYALIGLIIIFTIFALLKFIGYILGIKDLDTLIIPWPTL